MLWLPNKTERGQVYKTQALPPQSHRLFAASVISSTGEVPEPVESFFPSYCLLMATMGPKVIALNLSSGKRCPGCGEEIEGGLRTQVRDIYQE